MSVRTITRAGSNPHPSLDAPVLRFGTAVALTRPMRRGREKTVWEDEAAKLLELYVPKKAVAASIIVSHTEGPSLDPVHRKAKRRGLASYRFEGDGASLKQAIAYVASRTTGTIEVCAIGGGSPLGVTAFVDTEGALSRFRLKLMVPQGLERFSDRALEQLKRRGLRVTCYVTNENDPSLERAKLLDARVFFLEMVPVDKLPMKVVRSPRLPRLA